ncbi:MAG TPA: TonB family protein [Steroidobacteraceae bacterium]|nr:TonB family protein [Steroidobacteraceae bacterium]
MFASADERVAIAALTQDRALIGLLRSVVDPATDVILVTSEAELVPHLNGRRVSVALLDSMYVEGDLASLAERLRDNWSDLVLVVVGTAEEQSKVASQITSGVVYRFLHRPVSAPRVRLFVEAALRRHEVENVERTLEQQRPDFSRMEAAAGRDAPRGRRSSSLPVALVGLVLAAATVGGWYLLSGGEAPQEGAAAPVVSAPAGEAQPAPVGEEPAPLAGPAPPAAEVGRDTPLAEVPPAGAAPLPEPEPVAPAVETVAEQPRAADAAESPEPAAVEAPGRVQRTTELAVERPSTVEPAPPPVLTREQQLREKLALAEAALQHGELASPPGQNAVELFRGALELDPSNTLAKAGLVRVADRLLAAAERALTAGNAEDAKKMVDVAESLTPATSRGAFLMMQIEMERERSALTAKRDGDAQDRLERGTTYLRLAGTRLRSGALIEPAEDNARFYLEAARQTIPEDPAINEVARALQKELLARAGAAATAGNAAETERWLANADSAGAARQDITAVRRLLQERLIGVRSDRLNELAQSFGAALAANRLLPPAAGSAKSCLLELIDIDAGSPQVASARQGLGRAYLRELRAALGRDDIAAADAWLLEARTISYSSADLNAAESELNAARALAAQRRSVVGANSLARIEYVAPKFPTALGNRRMDGWVELEFTVRTDGSTGDIVVTNSSPRKLFDASAVRAVSQWRYKPVMLNGKAVEQRAAVRIRFLEE